MRDRRAMSAPGALEANQAFYEAFSDKDLHRMNDLWAQQAPVRCIHPGWDALTSREEIMASWMAIFSGAGAATVRCVLPQVLEQDALAIICCTEQIGEAQLVATNAFIFERGAWRMVLHHAGQVVQRVQFSTPPEHLN